MGGIPIYDDTCMALTIRSQSWLLRIYYVHVSWLTLDLVVGFREHMRHHVETSKNLICGEIFKDLQIM